MSYLKITVQGTPEGVTAFQELLREAGVEVTWASDLSKRSADAKWCSQRLGVKLPDLKVDTVSAPTVRVYERRQRGDKRNGKQPRSKAGFVYLMPTPTGEYKIGRTTNINSRKKTFSVKFPFAVEFIAVIKTEDAPALEKALHKRFAAKRLGGSEFFRLSEEDVSHIKFLAEQS